MIEHRTIVLPCSKKMIKMRPILIKEEKILVMAASESEVLEGEEVKDMLDAICQVVSNCTVEPKGLDWLSLPYSDFTYAFAQLRKISIGETFKLLVHCKDPKCKFHAKDTPETRDFKIDEALYIKNQDKAQSNIIRVKENLGVEVFQMTLKFVKELRSGDMLKKEHQLVINTKMVQTHIKAILKGEERYENLSPEEKGAFVDSLNTDQFNKIYDWHLEQPVPEIKIKWICSECKAQNEVSEVDLINFFVG